jgi:hypothetical protein
MSLDIRYKETGYQYMVDRSKIKLYDGEFLLMDFHGHYFGVSLFV